LPPVDLNTARLYDIMINHYGGYGHTNRPPLSRFALYAALLGFALFFVSSCGGKRIKEGKLLAERHCGSCHMVPEPRLLDKKTWLENVLPAMAWQVGIEVLEGNIYMDTHKSALKLGEWAKLVEYYQTLAPDTLLPSTETAEPAECKTIFNLLKPQAQSTLSSTMMVAIDTAGKSVFTSNTETPSLVRYDVGLRPEVVSPLASTAVSMVFNSNQERPALVTSMGGMQAMDYTRGQILAFGRDFGKPEQMSGDMIRPIETLPADFNRDGVTDFLVCAFGHNLGGLYILQRRPDQTFKKIAVRALPGATHSIIRDLNADGWPDIMTLFAHGDEGIWMFINDRKGGFKEKNLLRFPPVYGSSSFTLSDMNRDGLPDIVFTSGDNSDYSRIFKPYHGIYIFTNTGDFNFKQTFFHAVNGCTKAVVSDFDGDGDADIASIAFFADFKNKPDETFTYLQQESSNGNTAFKTCRVPLSSYGRWLCMDSGDVDGDGDDDIVLGNFSRGFLNQENIKPTWNRHLPFVILQNNAKRKSKP
jgi:hypothetical protein